MTIDEVYRFVNFISNKVQSGTVQPSNFNLTAQRAQMEYFERAYAVWQSTQNITDELKPFLTTSILSVDTFGKSAYPVDYVHSSSIRRNYIKSSSCNTAPVAYEIDVKEIDNDEIGSILSSSICAPTDRYPYVTYYDNYLQFFPKKPGVAFLDYLRKPKDPFWNFTVVSNRPVFNPIGSQDFEFPDEAQNKIIFMMCSYLGINLREGDLINYSEMQKKEQV